MKKIANKTKRKSSSKHNKKTKKYHLHDYVISIFTIALIILSLVSAFNSYMILEEKDFYSYLIVSDHAGFDLNNTAFTFGMISPGGSASRGLITENKYEFPIEVEIKPKGEIANFVRKQKATVSANETKEIGISAYAPTGTKYGNYTGSIHVVVKRYLFKR